MDYPADRFARPKGNLPRASMRSSCATRRNPMERFQSQLPAQPGSWEISSKTRYPATFVVFMPENRGTGLYAWDYLERFNIFTASRARIAASSTGTTQTSTRLPSLLMRDIPLEPRFFVESTLI